MPPPLARADGAGRSRIRPARRLRVVAWVERYPLAVCLPAQALLLLVDLDRLPLWGDEQTSLDRAFFGVVPADTVHPQLYFLLLRGWLTALGSGPSVVGARVLSTLFVLAATVAVDRCWLRRLEPRARAWFLLLWTLSPALLLYGRMARSYSLQVLLACLALSAGNRYACRPTPRSLVAYVAATAALLYTHYLPGIAVCAGVGTAMGWRALARRQPAALGAALLPPALIGLASVPWWPRLAGALTHVAGHSGYHVVGRAADVPLALAFTAVSFSVGESLWPWMVWTLPAIAPIVAVLLFRGVRAPPPWLPSVGAAALIGFVGAYQWVSYAFVAARLLFLLPFYLLLLVHGARGRFGAVACASLALLSLGGIAAYFAQTGFLNKAYVLPSAAIADVIRTGSPDGSITVVLDHRGTDLSAVAAGLPRGARVLFIVDAASATQAVALASAAGVRHAWFAHSTHDVSPEHVNARVIDAFARRFSVRRTPFVPYSALDRWLMHLAGWSQRPHYALELVEMGDDTTPADPPGPDRRNPGDGR